MPRQPNAIDFWRGFALLTIFVNHVPGIYYEKFTFRNVSISDSADLFVFLAGCSLRMASDPRDRRSSMTPIMIRLAGRIVTIYAAHILIVVIAIAMLATAAKLQSNPLMLEWHNAAAVFYDPVNTHIGLALLTHQLGYFDILPLYVVLMVFALAIVPLHRFAPLALLPISIALYLATLVFQLGVPSWPNDGQWFFNPLAWQMPFVLGFALAKNDGAGAFARRHLRTIRYVAWPIVLASAVMCLAELFPDPTLMPEPKLLFILSKSFETPPRLIQFLALVAVFSSAYPKIESLTPGVTQFVSRLGRNSLTVFCVGSLLSLGCQIVRFVYKAGIPTDTFIVAIGFGVLWLSAWLKEQTAARARPA